jgi:hypothetical protein
MIQVAHYVKPEQIVGGSSWVDTERFDMGREGRKAFKSSMNSM